MNSRVLKKPDAAIAIAPRIGRLTTGGRKMFNSMMYFAQEQLTDLKSQGLVQTSSDYYKAKLNEVMTAVGENPRSRMTELKKNVLELQDIKVKWASPTQDSVVLFASMVMLPSVKVTIESGITWLHWSFPPEINALLWDMERYAIIRLEELSRLTSYCAVALYEICAKYADNPCHLTCKQNPEWWVESLTSDPIGAKRYWKSFRPEKVAKAIHEINEKTNLHVELIEEKLKGKIISVQFRVYRIKKLNKAGEVNPLTKDGSEIVTKGVELGVSEMKMRSLIREGFPLPEIYVGLAKLEGRIKNDGLEPVDNPSSYLSGILKESRKLMFENDLSLSSKYKHDSKEEAIKKTPHGFIEQAYFVEDASPEPVDQFKIYFSNLTEEERSLSLKKLQMSFQSRGLLTPHVQRKFVSGDWHSPMIYYELKKLLQAEQQQQTETHTTKESPIPAG